MIALSMKEWVKYTIVHFRAVKIVAKLDVLPEKVLNP